VAAGETGALGAVERRKISIRTVTTSWRYLTTAQARVIRSETLLEMHAVKPKP
jgi:hypothetical protein